MNKLVIGITGGIGSGKSTVSKLFEEHGCIVLKADPIAKQVMVEEDSIISEITNIFGSESYIDGKLNTKYLASKVFSDPDQIKILNSIVHPIAIKKIEQLITQNLISNNIVIVESALIFESDMENLFDYILLLTAPEDTRIKRVIERDHESAHEIKSRIMNQLDDKEKIDKSDFVLQNNGSIEELKNKALFFLNLFKSL